MKYRAVFLRKYGESNYQKIGEKKIKPTDETVRFRDRTFKIPANHDTFSTKKKSFVYFDYDNSKILNFIPNTMILDAKMLDKFLAQNIIGKLVSAIKTGMEEPNKWKLMPYILAFIFGAVIGYTIAMQAI